MGNSNNKKAHKSLNRRDLFKTGLILTGGAFLSSAFKTSANAAGGKSNSSQKQVTTRRKLGGKLEVSSIGLGVQNMSRTYQTTIPTRSEMHNIIRTAFDHGVTLFDAAEAYGGSGQILHPGKLYRSPGPAKIAPWWLARRDPSRSLFRKAELRTCG